MSPSEIQLLQTFLTQLVQTQALNKDQQAQSMIADAIARQPDAAYLLVQRSLLLEQAVTNAQSQIAQLQAENVELKAARGNTTGGFLQATNTAWGNSVSSPPINSPISSPSAATSINGTSGTNGTALANPTAPALAPAFANQMASAPSSGFFGGNAGNMLGTVAATAAGVAAGAFLFQGIENLVGNHHGMNAGTNRETNPAASLSNADSGLIPNSFSEDKTAANNSNSSNHDSNSLADASGIDDISSMDDNAGADILDDV
ncbi:DUF2076 domain-containing protein [Undibacterium sp. RTI2.1]|uniref:DUF2076 domain-containing protein n=1 Tax=unclassified Undibacterium TaxID=2630295 RepID=UPI002B2331BB|nr:MULTISPECIES: DUF2076 domain-containing protein [unclassified Undibacterium]MEB0029684.1 DUF2076 domain-containing protein [Undibacterium sp. RTI2.1]MEB0116155.1 DUF2076 domain-containing protein [Undibacterium sp. RTI2.2]